MGTMRSGHYEACVQRGLSLSDSPSLQALLRKHGVAVPEASPAPDSSSTCSVKPGKRGSKAPAKAPAKASAKTSAKASAAAAAPTAAAKAGAQAGAAKEQTTSEPPAKAYDAQKGDTTDRHTAQSSSKGSASTAAAAQADGERPDDAMPGAARPDDAMPGAARPDDAMPGAARPDDAMPGAARPDGDTNGHAATGVPEEWDASESSSAAACETTQEVSHDAAGVLRHDSSDEGAADPEIQTADSASSRADATSEHVHEEPQQPGSSTTDQTASGQAAWSSLASAPVQQESGCAPAEGTSGPQDSSAPRTWYCISDAHVRVIAESDVLSREAYILLYMRVA